MNVTYISTKCHLHVPRTYSRNFVLSIVLYFFLSFLQNKLYWSTPDENNEIVRLLSSRHEGIPGGYTGVRGSVGRSGAARRHPERSIVPWEQGRASSFHGNRQGRDESAGKKAIREDRRWNERDPAVSRDSRRQPSRSQARRERETVEEDSSKAQGHLRQLSARPSASVSQRSLQQLRRTNQRIRGEQHLLHQATTHALHVRARFRLHLATAHILHGQSSAAGLVRQARETETARQPVHQAAHRFRQQREANVGVPVAEEDEQETDRQPRHQAGQPVDGVREQRETDVGLSVAEQRETGRRFGEQAGQRAVSV